VEMASGILEDRPHSNRPRGCLLLLLAVSLAGVLIYTFGVEGDPYEEPARFAMLISFGLIALVSLRFGKWLMVSRSRRRGFPVETQTGTDDLET
jgi:peptidoglycan/LPS O-acetylase OafA/YrhL